MPNKSDRSTRALFDTVALHAYLAELRDLAGSLLFRLDRLEAASSRWSDAHVEADAALRARSESFDDSRHARAVQGILAENREVFDELESFLAAWARLSLLIQPVPGRNRRAQWAAERGTILRRVLDVDDTSPLLSRDLRNAWMHFDERLDHAIRTTGRWRNRHRFTHSSEAEADSGGSIRCIAMDTLCVTYPDEAGVRRTTDLRALRPLLLQLVDRISGAGQRFRAAYAPHESEDESA